MIKYTIGFESKILIFLKRKSRLYVQEKNKNSQLKCFSVLEIHVVKDLYNLVFTITESPNDDTTLISAGVSWCTRKK